MGKARVTPNAAREVRDEKGKARGLSSAAAEMLAGRWENKGILTAAQVCIEELSTQGCSCDAAVPGWAGAGSATAWHRGKGPTWGSEIGQQESQRGGTGKGRGKPVCVGRGSPVGLL